VATVPAKPFTPAQERLATKVVKAMSVANVWLFRASGGRFGAKFLRGAPVCLVTVIGRRSGQPLTVPLIYVARGDDVVLVASKGGMSTHPLWYHNMMANPRVEVQIGRTTRAMTVRQADRDEKARLWPEACATYPDYADYQARTPRDIPVLVLSPV
jgi:deazaflavin-dependent oxidoreductase (nitroreductase family)